jgi:hypothetical protein
MAKVLRITLVRSSIGYSSRQKCTVKALGLRRMNQWLSGLIILPSGG